MMEPRNSEHRTKTYREDAYQGVASTKDGVWVAAGRAAYREEFQRDYGPDLDEPSDGTESRYEF